MHGVYLGEVAPEGPPGGSRAAASEKPMLVFTVYRDEFLQEGPSGPIEAKRVLLLKALPLQKSRVRGAAPPHPSPSNPPPSGLHHRPPALASTLGLPP